MPTSIYDDLPSQYRISLISGDRQVKFRHVSDGALLGYEQFASTSTKHYGRLGNGALDTKLLERSIIIFDLYIIKSCEAPIRCWSL
jgi:hypothetical protein